MSNNQISIDLEGYRYGVESIRGMSENLTDYSSGLPMPNNTNVPVLLEYMDKLNELNDVLLQYKKLLQKDIEDMNKIAETFEEMDEATRVQ